MLLSKRKKNGTRWLRVFVWSFSLWAFFGQEPVPTLLLSFWIPLRVVVLRPLWWLTDCVLTCDVLIGVVWASKAATPRQVRSEACGKRCYCDMHSAEMQCCREARQEVSSVSFSRRFFSALICLLFLVTDYYCYFISCFTNTSESILRQWVLWTLVSLLRVILFELYRLLP